MKNGTTAIDTLTVGGVTIGGSGTGYGITIGDVNKHVMISDHDISATGYVHASIISSGINARMSDGKVVAQNGLYIGYDGTDITKATYDNSRFAVNGENGSFKAANGKFTVSGSGAITADSLALTGTDGTTNVGAAIKDNANNIQAVNGRVTNIQTDVTSLKTTTGQLQTKVGELTDIDTAARNDIISLQKKTAGISEDGSKITTKSLKLRESGSLEEQEITAAKVKGYDEAVAAVGDTSTEGTLAYNTQKIKFKKDNKITSEDATYIEGITHAGDVRLAKGEVRAKSIVLEEVFDDGTSGQATLTRESIVNLHGMIDGKTKIKVADGSEVGDVTFDQGKVTNVVSINDNLKFESDGIYLNKGDQAKQIKIGTDGKIIIGTSSSAYDTNGFYAGGDDYTEAKAAIDGINGKIKGANGAFGVDDNGNVTTTGDINGKDITASGKLTVDSDATVGGNLGVTGDTTLKGKLDVTGDTTVGGNLHANKNAFVKGMLTVDGNIEGKGALKGKTLGIGSTGNEFTVDANGNTAVGGTLGVTGKTTLSDELQVDKTATFGTAVGSQTVIKGDQVATGRIETDATQASKIGGVTLQNGKVTATDMMVTGTIDFKNLKVNDTLTVGTNTKITEGTLQLGTAEDNKLTAEKLANINQTIKANRVIDATSATIGGVEINGGNVTATGTVQGKTIYDGVGAKLENGKITAKEGQIGNVTISAAGEVTGVKSIEASTFKVDEDNYLNGNGITAKEGKIGAVSIEGNTLNIGSTTLDKAEGITTNKLKIAGMTLTGTSLDTGTADFQVNGVTFNQGKVTAQADKGFVAGTSSFKEGSLIVDANNKLEATSGLTTKKATVKGNLDVTGKATFGTAGSQTTIEGDAITTDTLKANKLILGASGDTTVEVDKDGSLIAAKGKFKVDKDGALKAADGAFTVAKDGKTTFTKDADNLSSINGGNIWAKATDIADNTSSELTHDYKGLHIKGNKSGQKSAFDFDTASGIGTFTGQDNSTTKINGSAIRSEKIDGTAGKLDGENLTLYKDPNNQTTMSAGKATFTGDAGEKGGKVTTINGGTISTDTLNVERINLGEDILDSNGNPHGSNLSMDKQGNFSAAGGNFKVTGGSGADKGAFTNTVGNTTLQTDNAGASMKFDNTAADGGVESKVTVEANKATVAAGEKASFVATTDNGGTATITGGTQTVTTTDKGTVFENSAHKTAFVDNGATNTIINGNEITTGKITTDQLVITGKGNADGNGGSIAFGGNGTIKSDINDGTTNGKNTSFETTLDGVNTKVTNGMTTTENKVTAEGNSNTVKQDDTHKSEFNQGLTSIGGVVTNGEIKVAQKLDGATGLLTNEVTDANGSSKLEQSGTGLTYTDSANAGNATRIDSSDVSIGSATEPDKRINLSDLGQIDELDKEIRDNEVYKNNETAVGGINAEAAIRRGEVERLDNRISEEVTRLDGRINDVSDRVNKVGAMAAAIASLKSIGYDPQAPSEFSIGLGQYKGETGVAMGFFHYPNKNFMINVSLSTAGGETMGGIGATWRFGHKSPQKLLEEQREEQAKKELAAAEKYQAAAKLAKEAQERAEYAAKLARQAQVSADNAKAAADATQAKHFG
ncbi:S-layer family protein [Phascolarctobacterium succinatutens]|uniref:beta strand repeat-containing protein n=1 Tax=Phascolarctobacterium succinatutens TaxID=626940 RepID=UPI0025F52948|nr:YadA-like family protein [Phascolarctobacterium succinatutens]